jgi:hypothetical protein
MGKLGKKKGGDVNRVKSLKQQFIQEVNSGM